MTKQKEPHGHMWQLCMASKLLSLMFQPAKRCKQTPWSLSYTPEQSFQKYSFCRTSNSFSSKLHGGWVLRCQRTGPRTKTDLGQPKPQLKLLQKSPHWLTISSQNRHVRARSEALFCYRLHFFSPSCLLWVSALAQELLFRLKILILGSSLHTLIWSFHSCINWGQLWFPLLLFLPT